MQKTYESANQGRHGGDEQSANRSGGIDMQLGANKKGNDNEANQQIANLTQNDGPVDQPGPTRERKGS